MLGDDSFDMNAPFIDPCYDIPLGTGGLPQVRFDELWYDMI